MLRLVIYYSLIAMLLSGEAPAADRTLDEAVSGVVERMAVFLKKEQQPTVSLGEFINGSSAHIDGSTGPSIAKMFEDHFSAQQITIKKKSKYGINGQYSLKKNDDGELVVTLDGQMVEVLGEVMEQFQIAKVKLSGAPLPPNDLDSPEVKEKDVPVKDLAFKTNVEKTEDIAKLTGATVSLNQEDSKKDRKQDLASSIIDPHVFIEGSQCASSKASPYRMEILVNQAPCQLSNHENSAFATLQKGEAYVIRLYNNTEYEAAVDLSIDGLNVFTFSEMRNNNKPIYSVYVIPAGRFVDIPGWHIDNTRSDAFVITGYAESAAAKLNHQQNIGTITALFSAAWPHGNEPPADEGDIGKGDDLATGMGPPIKFVLKEVARDIGKLRSSVSIRYKK